MSELSGLYAMWLREVKVFTREKSRVISSVANPIFWLVIFGGGLGSSVTFGDYSVMEFIYPGILAMSVLFSSIFFGTYIIWDRKIDFLKEVLAAPMSRTTIFFGKVLGGCTDSLLQVMILVVIGLFIGVKFTPVIFLLCFMYLLLLAISMVSLGLLIGSKMSSPEGYGLIVSFVVFPLFFLSGALFPIDNLPRWLEPLILLNPVTYAVDGLRGAILGANRFPLMFDAVIMVVFCMILILAGAWSFEDMES